MRSGGDIGSCMKSSRRGGASGLGAPVWISLNIIYNLSSTSTLAITEVKGRADFVLGRARVLQLVLFNLKRTYRVEDLGDVLLGRAWVPGEVG